MRRLIAHALLVTLIAVPAHASLFDTKKPSSGSPGAPLNAPYWVGGPNGTLTSEKDLSVFTGLVLNSAGTPSQYPGVTCTNQVIRILSTSGAATCQTITSAYIDSSIVPSTRQINTTAPLYGGGTLSDNLMLTTSMATARVLGRVTAGTGVAEELTGTQATTLLDVFTSGLKGLAPSSGGGTTNFLRADGSWAAPPGGSGAPTDATYWVGAAHAGLSAEINLGALGTGLVINTTGTPSIYAGTTCTNQFARALSAAGVATCNSVAGTDFASQSANFFFAAPNGSAGTPTFRALVDADVPNTITLDNLTQITTRAISDTTGTLSVGRGGTGQTAVTTNQLYVGTGPDTLTAKTLPSCSNGTTSKLLFNSSTQEFSCGTDQSGGVGASWTEYEIDFGVAAKFVDVETVTDASVSGSSRIIVLQSGAAATGRQTDENEMDVIQCNANPGTGQFTLRCHSERTVVHGKFKVLYNIS